MASTVSNGSDRSEKWQRPFQIATTVYEREISAGEPEQFQLFEISFIFPSVTNSEGLLLPLSRQARHLKRRQLPHQEKGNEPRGHDPIYT